MPSSRLRAALGFRSISSRCNRSSARLGLGVFGHGIGVLQFLPDAGFMFFGQVIDDVAPLVDLAALDERRLARVTAHRRCQRLAAVQDIQPRHAEVQPRSSRSLSNSLTTAAFSVAPSRMPNTVLRPSQPMPRATIICRSLNGVPSISTAHSRNSPSGRSINCFTFSRLASMKFSLTADFSIP